MRKVIVGIAIGISVLSVPVPAYSQPTPKGKTHVVIQGITEWPELNSVVRELRTTWGVPIEQRVCTGEATELCVWWRHRSHPGDAVYARGDATFGIEINNAFPPAGSAHRKAIAYHELGHVLGLPHNEAAVNSCESSMATSALCNGNSSAPLGYSPSERLIIWKNLGKSW